MKKYDYTNKKVLITGASSGIGKELTTQLINNYNCDVIGIGRNEARLKALQTFFPNKFKYIIMDVQSKENWQKLAKEILDIDILINCAGILPQFSSFENLSYDDITNTFNTNFFSQIYAVKELLPIIKKSSNGMIINISSSSALCPFGLVSIYSSSKAASDYFTECIKEEISDIRVVSVMPGFTKTNILTNQNFKQSELKTIDSISQPVEKACTKILKRASKSSRVIVGFDAKCMSFFYKLFPKLTPMIITKILKNTKFKQFDN